MGGWMYKWVDGREGTKAGLRIAYSHQTYIFLQCLAFFVAADDINRIKTFNNYKRNLTHFFGNKETLNYFKKEKCIILSVKVNNNSWLKFSFEAKIVWGK